MDANFDTNVDDIAEVGVGQALNAVAPISANSLFKPAVAGSNVEVGIFPASMSGATGVPAPNETAVSQFQFLDGDPSSKVTEMLTRLDGGNPPVVGRKPTGSEPAAPLFLAPQKWSKEAILDKFGSVFGIDICDHDFVDFGFKSTIALGNFEFEDDSSVGLSLWSSKRYYLDIGLHTVMFDGHELGDVLANYEYGGVQAVVAYLESVTVDNDSSAEPEGSQSLAANSPEHVTIDSALENGESDE